MRAAAGPMPPQNAARDHQDRFDTMAKGIFGERLKRERELREVTLEEISKATRIAPRFMDALENEQWNRLPGGVFGRGFVRSIARYLGLNEEDLLSEYDLARKESANAAGNAKPEERIPSPPKWIPLIAGALVIAVLVGLAMGGRYAWKAYQAHRAAKKSSAIVGIPTVAQPETLAVSIPNNSRLDAAANANAAPLDLTVAAAMNTPMRVVADGNVAFDGEMAQGQSLHFSAADRLEVSTTDFSAVLLELNGQTVAATGAAGGSGTIVLTAKDTRPFTGGNSQH